MLMNYEGPDDAVQVCGLILVSLWALGRNPTFPCHVHHIYMKNEAGRKLDKKGQGPAVQN